MKVIDGRYCIAFGLILFAVGCWMFGDLNMQAAFDDTLWPRDLPGLRDGVHVGPDDDRDAQRNLAR